MGKRYLLDTNIVLDYMGDKLPVHAKDLISQIIDDEINLSAINKIELLGFARTEQDLVDFVACANIFPLTDQIVDKTISIRKECRIKLPDALNAATALVHSLVLLTNNERDFTKVQSIAWSNPHLWKA